MTAGPEVKTLDAIITQLGIEKVLVVGRNAQGFALSRKPVGPMIRLGKVYAGLMVDVQASNAKIAERRENMLIHLTGKSAEEVREAAP